MSRAPMNWKKAKTRPHGRPSPKDTETMAQEYSCLFCSACRVTVMVPTVTDGFGNGRIVHPGEPWAIVGKRWFCSAECQEKGEAKPVREPVEAHIDWERGTKVSFERQLGRSDALQGFDCVGHRPEYVKGHGEGMAVRSSLEDKP